MHPQRLDRRPQHQGDAQMDLGRIGGEVDRRVGDRVGHRPHDCDPQAVDREAERREIHGVREDRVDG